MVHTCVAGRCARLFFLCKRRTVRRTRESEGGEGPKVVQAMSPATALPPRGSRHACCSLLRRDRDDEHCQGTFIQTGRWVDARRFTGVRALFNARAHANVVRSSGDIVKRPHDG